MPNTIVCCVSRKRSVPQIDLLVMKTSSQRKLAIASLASGQASRIFRLGELFWFSVTPVLRLLSQYPAAAPAGGASLEAR
jgi:hypothetical protein